MNRILSKRFVTLAVPVVVVGLVRFCIGLLLMVSLPNRGVADWMNLFAHWDTGYYYGIAESWYPTQLSPLWAFFPLYPAVVSVLRSIGLDVQIGALLVSTLTGATAIVLFHIVARHYLQAQRALYATLLYFLLPPVFVFSGVNYSEPLFLLVTLLAWYFHLRGSEMWSGVASTLSALARPYGVLIAVPLAYDYFRNGRVRKLAYLVPSLVAVGGWGLYSYLMTGTFAFLAARSYWNSAGATTFANSVTSLLMGHEEAVSTLFSFALRYLPLTIAALATCLLFVALSVRAYRIERALGIYNLACFLTITYFNFIPGFGSFPRLLGFLFPLGLGLHTRRSWIVAFVSALFVLLDYVAWWAFITDGFR